MAILVSFLPIFLLPKDLEYKLMQNYLQQAEQYLAQIGSLENFTPFALTYLSRKSSDMQALVDRTRVSAFELYEDLAEPELETVRRAVNRDLCRENSTCVGLMDGLLQEGMMHFLQNLKTLYEEQATLEKEEVGEELMRDMLVGWSLVEQSARDLCAMQIRHFTTQVRQFNDTILAMNVAQFFCILLLSAILLEVVHYTQTRQLTAWNAIQLFTSEMLMSNEYFKTFVSRQKKQSES